MGFGDVFKSSFLENITSVSILDMVIALVLAFGIGMFIFFVYKKTYSGVMYAPGHVELNLEVRVKDDNADFVNILSEMDGVNSASLVSFNGEYL